MIKYIGVNLHSLELKDQILHLALQPRLSGCCWSQELGVSPWGPSGQSLPPRAHHNPQDWGRQGQPQPPASDTFTVMRMGQGWAGSWIHGWAQLSGTRGCGEQVCGKLGTIHSVASMAQWLTALEGWNGVLGHGKGGESPGGAGQGQSGLVVPTGLWWLFWWLLESVYNLTTS